MTKKEELQQIYGRLMFEAKILQAQIEQIEKQLLEEYNKEIIQKNSNGVKTETQ